jgi:hypothetical protein
MTNTLEIINRMQSDGVVSLYAIGGSAAATFYIKPLASLEADIFVMLPSRQGNFSLSLTPVYEYCTLHGVAMKDGVATIGSWPGKFLPVENELEHEALDEAVETEIKGVKCWVMTAEHLVALALRSSRPEDLALISQFMESGKVDGNKLHLMLHRHSLGPQWHQFTGTQSEK